MARRESGNKNELKIHDNISDSDVVLFYRMPSTSERQGYQNMVIQRKRNKVDFNQAEARLKYGLKVLTGFVHGSFERNIDGNYVAFTWEEGCENYLPEWKSWIENNAGDLVMLLAGHVFDSPAVITDKDKEDGEDIEGK